MMRSRLLIPLLAALLCPGQPLAAAEMGLQATLKQMADLLAAQQKQLDQQAKVFTPFTRFHQARAKGHGLGLSIAQRIVEKLGGQVGVDSAGAGQGCTFWFMLHATT